MNEDDIQIVGGNDFGNAYWAVVYEPQTVRIGKTIFCFDRSGIYQLQNEDGKIVVEMFKGV